MIKLVDLSPAYSPRDWPVDGHVPRGRNVLMFLLLMGVAMSMCLWTIQRVRSVVVDVGPCCDSNNRSQTSSMDVSHRLACNIIFVLNAICSFQGKCDSRPQVSNTCRK